MSFYTMIAELGYHLEPYTVIWLISDLAKNNITTLESVLQACPQSLSSTNSLRWFLFLFESTAQYSVNKNKGSNE